MNSSNRQRKLPDKKVVKSDLTQLTLSKKELRALDKWARQLLKLDIWNGELKALKEARHKQRYAHSSRLMSIINAKKLKERLKLDEEGGAGGV